MSDRPEEYGYETFAETDEYLKVNGTIVRRWVTRVRDAGGDNLGHVLDLATGVGTMVQLLLDVLPSGERPQKIICVDMSAEALRQAEQALKGFVGELRFVRASLQDLRLESDSVDAAIWGNGIHYLNPDEQAAACRNVRRTVRKHGWFFLNSAFYEEARPANTLAFYRSQIAEAVRYLRSRGISRDRSRPHPDSANYLPHAYYRRLLEQSGFEVEAVEQIEARLYRSAVEKISGFPQYATGALHGYPSDAAVEALTQAVSPSLAAYGLRDERNEPYIPRYWLSLTARAN